MGTFKVRNVLLDLGGVLLTYNFNSIIEGFKKCSILPREEIKSIVLGPLKNNFDSGKISPDQFYSDLCDRLGIVVPRSLFIEIWSNIFSRNQEMLDFMLSRFHRKDLFILSNTDPFHIEWIRAQFPELNGFGGYVFSYELGILKPSCEYFKQAISRCGLKADECLFVDDDPENVAGAKKAGIRSIQYKNFNLFLTHLREISPMTLTAQQKGDDI